MGYRIFDFQLVDTLTGRNIITTGGAFTICVAGTPDKVPLYDPVTLALIGTDGKAPVALVRGHITAAVLDTVDTVDILGFAPGGQFFEFLGHKANALPDGLVDTSRREQVARIPFSIADAVANVEKDTGFDFPVGSLVSPFAAVRVTTLEASRTISFGILSSESGGSATGFINAITTAAANTVAAKSAATATRGSLIGAGTLDTGYPVVTASQSISYTLAASTVSAKGFGILPYLLTA
jgi:hypothetical protein